MQKQDNFVSPLIDQQAKEGKDKKVVFEAKFSKANAKAKWFCRKDVRTYDMPITLILVRHQITKIQSICFDSSTPTGIVHRLQIQVQE